MGASDTPLYDLIELQGLLSYTTYTTTPGGGGDIIGTVDNATYTDTHTGNSATQITEINTTADADNGVLTIDGVDYRISLADPDNTNVTITYNGGASTIDLTGDSGTSDVVFIIAEPTGGGSTRWFMAVDDSVGDLPDITSIQIRALDWSPAGDDVKINLDENNTVTACLTAGTMIDTPDGPRPVETLAVGDLVTTLDHGPRPVLWIHSETLRFGPGGARDTRRPIRIQRGALGPGLPARSLTVSPQHRLLVSSPIARRMFGDQEVLVPAVKLKGLPGIGPDGRATQVTYLHLFFGTHELVLAEGAPVESFLPEAQALSALSRTERRALCALAPTPVDPARLLVETGAQVRELLRRHRKNVKPLCDPGVFARVKRATAHRALRLVAA